LQNECGTFIAGALRRPSSAARDTPPAVYGCSVLCVPSQKGRFPLRWHWQIETRLFSVISQTIGDTPVCIREWEPSQ